MTSSTSPPVSVHDCKNHWDTGSITKKPTCTEPEKKPLSGICESTKKKAFLQLDMLMRQPDYRDIVAVREKLVQKAAIV